MTSRQKKSILFIIGSTNAGGVPAFLFNLIQNLEREGIYDMALVAPNDGSYYKRFIPLVKTYNKKARGFNLFTIAFIRKLIRHKQFDIIYANGRGAGITGRLAAMGTQAKVVYSYHGFNYDHLSRLKKFALLSFEKIALRYTSRVICVSESERETAVKSRLLTRDKTIVIPCGIDFNPIKPVQRKSSGHTIGLLSKICIQKGIEYVVDAMALLKTTYPDIKCLIAGKTLKEERIREAKIIKKIQRSGLEDTVVLLGEILDIKGFFSKINVYVSASLWEGLPIAILEAFSLKVPVVATNVMGNCDLVVHGQTGILVEPENSQSLADGIEHAFTNREQMTQYAENAYQYGRRHFPTQQMIDRHLSLYNELIANDRL